MSSSPFTSNSDSPKSEADRLISNIKKLIESPDDKAVIGELYSILSILDAKASGSLSLNGILLAVITFMSSEGQIFRFQAGAWWLLVLLGFVGVFISLLLCLWIVNIRWKFYDKVSNGEEINALADEVGRRTKIYQWAWKLTFCSGALILGGVIASQAFAWVCSR